jgi:hypothetical protein
MVRTSERNVVLDATSQRLTYYARISSYLIILSSP